MNHPHAVTPLRALLVLLLFGPLVACHASRETAETVRVATFNAALSRDTEGALHAALAAGDDEQAKRVAEVIQRTRPDILLLQEFDYDPTGEAYTDFQLNYLSVSQNGAEPIRYEHVYAPPVNTGVLAEIDIDGDGQITRPNDCYGYGLFDGHYGMVVLSKHPIDSHEVQTFREVLWNNTPRNIIPQGYYSDEALARLRLSSKTHARVPIVIECSTVELLISHPTPPAFDGPEDRNGRRNYDEIGLWLFLLEPGSVGRAAAFPPIDRHKASDRVLHGTRFLVMGDLNADPNDGASRPGAIQQLLDHPRIQDVVPSSQGGVEAAKAQGGKNNEQRSDPAADTSDFGDTGRGPGNLRVDYVLPSIDLDVAGSGVYWPTADDPHAYLNKASDHKLVWLDLTIEQ